MIKLDDLEIWADDNQEYFINDSEPDVTPLGLRVITVDSTSAYDDDEDIYDMFEEDCLWIS